MKSTLQKSQYKKFTKNINFEGKPCVMTVKIQYDDECENGHNSFSITGDIKNSRRYEMGGCIHEEIAKFFPEFKHLIKWHLMTSEGPLYYIDNTTFEFKRGNIEQAKMWAVWGVTPLDTDVNLRADVSFLMRRLPYIMEAFKKDIEALEFIF